MTNENKKSAVELAFLMGEVLLENGAEISRIQDTMERVAAFYKVDSFDVFVLTNAIMGTGSENGKEYSTKIKFARTSALHLGRVSELNQLSREICEGKYTVDEAYEKALTINKIPSCSKIMAIIAGAVSSACFCYVCGSQGVTDSIAAFFCGIILQLYLLLIKNKNISKFIINISGSALMAFCAIVIKELGYQLNLSSVIIGSIFPLLPGVALTTSIRDFLNSDYLSGTIRFVDATLIGGCIAIGVGIMIKLYSLMGGAVI